MKSIHQIISLVIFCSFSFCIEANTQSVLMGSETVPTGSAKDTLLFFNQDLGALRFGNINTSQNWNLINLGRNSFAAGVNTRASGINSVALGDASIATGNTTFSFGRSTQSTANYAFSAGQGSKATGIASVAMGENTLASGVIATAFGSNSDATGNYSLAVGKDNIASEDHAIAIGNSSVASGPSSIAMGKSATATNTSSIALGNFTNATGAYSFATGNTTHAKALNSFVFGRHNEGLGSESSWEPTEPILEVGIGADAGNKANALTILKNGNHGIGTSAPLTLLDVRGSTRIERASSSSDPHLELHDTNDGFGRLKFSRPSGTSDNYWTIAARPSEGDIASRFNVKYNGDSLTSNILSVTGLGRLGINGTPSDALFVNSKEGDHAMRVMVEGQTKLRVLNNGGTTIGVNNTNSTPANGLYVSGNTGIGVGNPTEKLEVDGAIVLGSTFGTKEGAIRYRQGDFEGFNGTKWVSLTGPKSTWGEVPESSVVVERAVKTSTFFSFSSDYGHDIDISGDYALVNTPSYDVVTIFKANGYDWDFEGLCDPDDIGSDDMFGFSVDIAGDYFIAGAPFHDDVNTDQGAAYIYKKIANSDDFEEFQKLTDPSGLASSIFGSSVAIKGIHAVVAAQDGTNADLAIHIYKFQSGSWTLQQKLYPPGFNPNVDVSLDLSVDGEYIVCGVPGNDANGQTSAGKAYVYIRSGSTWSMQNELESDLPVANAEFGYSAVIDGSDLVIGSHQNDVNGMNEVGSAYYYKLDGANWTFEQKLDSPSPHEFGGFGYSIDMDDGHLLISQPGKCQSTNDFQRVSYLYKKVGSYWTMINELKPSSYDETTLGFGTVAMDGGRIIIGTNKRTDECNGQIDHPSFYYSQE